MKKYAFIVLAALAAACGHVPHDTGTAIRPSEYVSTLVGTQSDYRSEEHTSELQSR